METLDAYEVRWLDVRRRKIRTAHTDHGSYAKWIGPALGALDVTAIARADLRRWVAKIDEHVLAGDIAWATARRIWTVLRVLFRDSCSSKVDSLRVREDDPTAGVRPPDRGPQREATFLYPSEFRRLVEARAIPLRVRQLYALAVYLYPRAGEIAALRCEDCDLDRGIVRISRSRHRWTKEETTTKTAASREWIVEPPIVPLLRALAEEVGGRGRLLQDWCRTEYAKSLRRHLREVGCERADLFADDEVHRPITGHDLRATGITWRAIRGDAILDIQEAVGHRSVATTERYVRRGRALARAFHGEVFPELGALLEDAPRGRRVDRTPGPCHRCGRPAKGAMCLRCRLTGARQQRKRIARLRKAGRCWICAAPIHVDEETRERRSLCRKHLDYYAERARKSKRPLLTE